MKLSEGARPTPAMVLAALALVFAMAGTAIAGPDAVSNKVTKSKVKTIANKQIDKRLPLGTSDIADAAITTGKLDAAAVSTNKIGDDQVTGAKVDEATLGAPLLKNREIVFAASANNSISPKSVSVTCPGAKQLIGGGASIRVGFLANAASAVVKSSAPSHPIFGGVSQTTWTATGEEYTADGDNWNVRAYAICADG